MKNVIVRQERHYGRLAFYPVNETANLFCQLVKRYSGGATSAKSLTKEQLEIIKQLGHSVEVVAEVAAV
mgnify:CR=1 FL=1